MKKCAWWFGLSLAACFFVVGCGGPGEAESTPATQEEIEENQEVGKVP